MFFPPAVLQHQAWGLCLALSDRALHGGNEAGEDPIDRKTFCPYFTELLSQRKWLQRQTISEHIMGLGIGKVKRVIYIHITKEHGKERIVDFGKCEIDAF